MNSQRDDYFDNDRYNDDETYRLEDLGDYLMSKGKGKSPYSTHISIIAREKLGPQHMALIQWINREIFDRDEDIVPTTKEIDKAQTVIERIFHEIINDRL